MRKRIDWKTIAVDFHAGKISVRGIAITHGVSEGAIRKRAKVGGWWRQRTDCAPSAFALALTLQRLLDSAPTDLAARLRMGIDRIICEFGAEIESIGQSAAGRTN
jgi:hypothetical protein